MSVLKTTGLKILLTSFVKLQQCQCLPVKNSVAGCILRNMSNEADKSKRAVRESKTIFEKIIFKEIKADIIYEDDECLAFNDVSPQAPVHFLVIPKRKIPLLDEATSNDKEMLGHLILTAKDLAKVRLPNGYRVVINNGVEGCQSVYHLHVHVIGGRQMKWPPG